MKWFVPTSDTQSYDIRLQTCKSLSLLAMHMFPCNYQSQAYVVTNVIIRWFSHIGWYSSAHHPCFAMHMFPCNHRWWYIFIVLKIQKSNRFDSDWVTRQNHPSRYKHCKHWWWALVYYPTSLHYRITALLTTLPCNQPSLKHWWRALASLRNIW